MRPGCVVILHDRWHTPATLRAYFAHAPAIRLTTLTEAVALAEAPGGDRADSGGGRDARAPPDARRETPGPG